MALSPNYGWAEPDNSSLVKNGAQDIRALGDAIDTSVWNVGYGQAGKNKIINGDFGIWQRGTSFAGLTALAYTADRFIVNTSGATVTVSQQTFTPGTAPVAGYEGKFFLRCQATVANDFVGIAQFIEDVQTFAGQTMTVSFWAKAAAANTLRVFVGQNFGSGGSTQVTTTATPDLTLTTSWARYSVTVAVPSISGKTVGTGNYLAIQIYNPNNETSTMDFWGVQVEYGSKATPFQTASGESPQAELAMCQRYYERRTATDAFNTFAAGSGQSTTAAWLNVNTKVTLRAAPTSIEFSNLGIADGTNAAIAVTGLVVQGTTNGTNSFNLVATVAASGVQYRPYYLLANNSSSAYVAWSSEL
jgi:hypothetical protein